MKEYKFQTNIKCGGCVATVTPHLEADEGVKNWKVDIASPEKVLTVETEDLTKEQITELVGKAGFKAEAIS